MAEAGGWIVAVLVAVVAILARCLTNARAKATKAPSAPPTDDALVRQRGEVVEATRADIEGLWHDLESDDPSGAIADAANRAREDR